MGEEWEDRHDALYFWNAMVATHNAISTGNNDMDRIKMRRLMEYSDCYSHLRPAVMYHYVQL